jgi:phosphatidylglycerophosphate synthase
VYQGRLVGMEKIPPIHELRKVCHPTESHRRDVYRKIGIYFVRPLLFLGVTPNFITLMRVLFISIGFYIFIQADTYSAIIGSIIFQFCILLDTFDGAIARYRKMSSKLGEYYDFVLDHISASIIYFLSIGIYIFYTNLESTPLYISIATIILINLSFILRIFYRVENIDTTELKKDRLFSFFYQDNARLIVNLITLCSITALLFSNTSPILGLIICFFIFSIIKFIYISFLFHSISGRFPFSFSIIKDAIRFSIAIVK